MAGLTEKHKMLAGKLFDINDKILKKEYLIAANLLFKLNNTKPSLIKKREKIIRKLFGKTSKNFEIISPFFCDYGYNIEIGENFFCNFGCVILDAGKVKFGDNVFLAPNVNIYTVEHPIDPQERALYKEFAKPIRQYSPQRSIPARATPCGVPINKQPHTSKRRLNPRHGLKVQSFPLCHEKQTIAKEMAEKRPAIRHSQHSYPVYQRKDQ